MTRDGGRPAVGWVVAVLLVAGCSGVVRLPDCIDCRPVEMRLGETLEVELGSDRAVTSDPDAYEWAPAAV
jgi:hypothetical protein